MTLYVVESPTLAEDKIRDEKTPHIPDMQALWIAKMPKGVDASPGKTEVNRLCHLLQEFNRSSGKQIKLAETSWLSRQIAIEATAEEATAFAAATNLSVKAHDGKKHQPIPTAPDGGFSPRWPMPR